jgi:hypothetical protein
MRSASAWPWWVAFRIRFPIAASIVRPWFGVALVLVAVATTLVMPSALVSRDFTWNSLNGRLDGWLAWQGVLVVLALLALWARGVTNVRWSAPQVLLSQLLSCVGLAASLGLLALLPTWVNQTLASTEGNDALCREGLVAYSMYGEDGIAEVLQDPTSTNQERLSFIQGSFRGWMQYGHIFEVTLQCESIPPALEPGSLPDGVVWYQPGDIVVTNRYSDGLASLGYGRPVAVRFTHGRSDRQQNAHLVEAWFANGDALRGAWQRWFTQWLAMAPVLLLFQTFLLLKPPPDVAPNGARVWGVATFLGFFGASTSLSAVNNYEAEAVLAAWLASLAIFGLMAFCSFRRIGSIYLTTSGLALALALLAYVHGMAHLPSWEEGAEVPLVKLCVLVTAMLATVAVVQHRNRCTALRP